MQPQPHHYILPLSPVVKPIYEKCLVFPEEWGVRPDKLVIHVVNNMNIADPANLETIINLYVTKLQTSLINQGIKVIDAPSINDICKMIMQLYCCLTQMYTLHGIWQSGLSANLKFHNFVDYDVILTTG